MKIHSWNLPRKLKGKRCLADGRTPAHFKNWRGAGLPEPSPFAFVERGHPRGGPAVSGGEGGGGHRLPGSGRSPPRKSKEALRAPCPERTQNTATTCLGGHGRAGREGHARDLKDASPRSAGQRQDGMLRCISLALVPSWRMERNEDLGSDAIQSRKNGLSKLKWSLA